MPQDPQLFSAAERSTVIAVSRVLYPHPGLTDGPYERTTDLVLEEARRAPALALAVRNVLSAVAHVAEAAQDRDRQVLEVLEGVQHTDSFETLRSRTCHHLYADREVWDAMGYPGPSFHLGGYLHRGFDDLSWLPEPRVEEPAEPLVEVARSAAVPTGDRA